jgi:hypothetical protein
MCCNIYTFGHENERLEESCRYLQKFTKSWLSITSYSKRAQRGQVLNGEPTMQADLMHTISVPRKRASTLVKLLGESLKDLKRL